MAKRYTPEEVWYEDAGLVTLGPDAIRKIMSSALSKVPREVADAVLGGCRIIVPTSKEKGCYIPAELTKDRAMLSFPETIFDGSPEEAEETLLHEVAHYWLKHRSPLADGLSETEGEQQELEADDQVRKWLGECAV